jgi:NCS1 family nucleobase:cation symporter-1
MFTVKVVIMPFFGLALFVWALTAGHGWGPLFRIPNNISNGRSVGYVFCSAITASIATTAGKREFLVTSLVHNIGRTLYEYG